MAAGGMTRLADGGTVVGMHPAFVIEPDVEDALNRADVFDVVQDAMLLLPPRLERVLRMYYLEGMTQAQIGQIFGFGGERAGQLREKAIGKIQRSLLRSADPGIRADVRSALEERRIEEKTRREWLEAYWAGERSKERQRALTAAVTDRVARQRVFNHPEWGNQIDVLITAPIDVRWNGHPLHYKQTLETGTVWRVGEKLAAKLIEVGHAMRRDAIGSA